MPNNAEKLHQTWNASLPGEAGVKSAGDLWLQANAAKNNSAAILDALTPGKAGVRSAGHIVGMLARIEGNTAVIQNLVKALANVSGGESFDQTKLLAGIEKLLAEAVVKVEVSVEGAE